MYVKFKNVTKYFYRKKPSTSILKSLKCVFFPEYERIRALHSVSFEIDNEEIVGLLGPNGAGKTTVSRIICGILRTDKGSVEVFGKDPFKHRKEVVRRLGVVFGHKYNLPFDLRAYDAVRVLSMYFDVEKDEFEERFWKYAECLNVSHLAHSRIRELSLGERRKFELIGALVHDPEFLILDEPTLGLDFESKATVREMLRKLGKPVLFTSHDALDIENVCSRVIVLRRGEVVFDGSMSALKKRIRKRIVKIQTRNPVDVKVPYLRKITDYVFEGTVSSQRSLEKLLDVFLPYGISDLEVRYPSMEEVLMDVFKD